MSHNGSQPHRRYCVLHNGCDPLEADAAGVRRQLQDTLGLLPVSAEEADVLVCMACTFSRQKEEQFERSLAHFCGSSNGGLVIASGCYLREAVSHPNVRYCRTDEVAESVRSVLGLPPYPSVAVASRTTVGAGIVVISEGCYGRCAFCSVKTVRGEHRSRPLDDIMDDIARMPAGKGPVKLAGQDVAAYGRDQGRTLWGLLRAVAERFPGPQIELGPLGPEWLIRSEKSDLALLANENITGNIHVPLQSASNAVLKCMKRRYACEEFEALWGRLSEVGVQSTSTDIMAGFPGETLEDHEKTLEFLRTHKLAFAQIFMYEPRPGTEAARHEAPPVSTRMARTMELVAEYLRANAEFRGISLEELVSDSEEMLFNTNIQFGEEVGDEG